MGRQDRTDDAPATDHDGREADRQAEVAGWARAHGVSSDALAGEADPGDTVRERTEDGADGAR